MAYQHAERVDGDPTKAVVDVQSPNTPGDVVQFLRLRGHTKIESGPGKQVIIPLPVSGGRDEDRPLERLNALLHIMPDQPEKL